MRLEPIDLHHQATEQVVGVYLLETDDGPALFDCGPTVCIPRLKEGLAAHGLALTDVRHLLLSHIHLDHAGAAGTLVREHPGLQVHVSEIGAPHLVDPSRLDASARRLYGDAFDALWGELAPVPEENVHVVGDDVVGLACFPTPGPCVAPRLVPRRRRDALRRRRGGRPHRPGTATCCPCRRRRTSTYEQWLQTLDEIERRRPERLALIHFGVVEDVADHLTLMREELHRWVERVEDGATEEEFVEAGRAELAARVPGRPRPLAARRAALAVLPRARALLDEEARGAHAAADRQPALGAPCSQQGASYGPKRAPRAESFCSASGKNAWRAANRSRGVAVLYALWTTNWRNAQSTVAASPSSASAWTVCT